MGGEIGIYLKIDYVEPKSGVLQIITIMCVTYV